MNEKFVFLFINVVLFTNNLKDKEVKTVFRASGLIRSGLHKHTKSIKSGATTSDDFKTTKILLGKL